MSRIEIAFISTASVSAPNQIALNFSNKIHTSIKIMQQQITHQEEYFVKFEPIKKLLSRLQASVATVACDYRVERDLSGAAAQCMLTAVAAGNYNYRQNRDVVKAN